MKFKQINIDRAIGVFENVSYLPDIVNLAVAFRDKLFDDYFIPPHSHITAAMIDLIEDVSPYFWVVTTNKGGFMGFGYLYDWYGPSGDGEKTVNVTTCFMPEFWGKPAVAAGKRFIKYVFYKYNLRKLKAEVYATNRYTHNFLKKLGFKYEYTALSETVVNNSPVNTKLYSIIKHK